MMNFIINYFTQNTGKGFLTSILTFVFGASVTYVEPCAIDIFVKWLVIVLQVSSFSVAIFVGVLSAISWFEKRKTKKKQS